MEKRKFSKPTFTTKIIPKDGKISLDQIYTQDGFCEICDKPQRHLRRHFKRQHTEAKVLVGQKSYKVKVVPEDGNVKIADVYSLKGRCEMKGCKKEYIYLREHFVNFHLKKTKPCTTCNKEIILAHYHAHFETHSGPTKCDTCNRRYDSVQGVKCHIRRYHKGINVSTFTLLTEEEAKEYSEYRETTRKLSEKRQNGKIRIEEMQKTLDVYEKRLTNAGDILYKKKTNLKLELEKLIEVKEDDSLKYNASFVTEWNEKNKIPRLVFEILNKTSNDALYFSTSFWQDPKLQNPHQPDLKDYEKSGLHRGHLASASNYHDEMLVAPTYYYTNIVPMYQNFNQGARRELEAYLRELAEDYGEVKAFHFPFAGSHSKCIGKNKVSIPESVATVAIVKKPTGLCLYGWEIWNQIGMSNLDGCERDPFSIFIKANYLLKVSKTDFVEISEDAL